MNENKTPPTEKSSESEKKNLSAPSSRRPLIKKRDVTTTFMPEARYDDAYGKENKYYIRIANKYRLFKYIVLVL